MLSGPREQAQGQAQEIALIHCQSPDSSPYPAEQEIALWAGLVGSGRGHPPRKLPRGSKVPDPSRSPGTCWEQDKQRWSCRDGEVALTSAGL